MTLRVLIADDHTLFRKGLRTLLEKQAGTEVLGEADNGRTMVKMARQLHPDIVIMDIAMPGMNGIEATRKIVSTDPDVRILALSMHSDRRFVVKMFQAGAFGYMLKDCAFEELAFALQALAENRKYLCPTLPGMVIDDFIKQNNTSRGPALTPRESEVLQLLAEGMTTREIAELLTISGKTVETHRRKIMHKLNLHSIAELTKYAIREGITGIGD